MIYIFDIDGTLADMTHRLPLIKQPPKDWAAFYQACSEDKPIKEIIEINRSLNSAGNHCVMITGRSDEIRMKTLVWFGRHGVFCDLLLMRKAGDHREDSVVKSDLLNDLMDRYPWPGHRIAGVFEDRKQVVDMYRARGLRVFQVAEGDF